MSGCCRPCSCFESAVAFVLGFEEVFRDLVGSKAEKLDEVSLRRAVEDHHGAVGARGHTGALAEEAHSIIAFEPHAKPLSPRLGADPSASKTEDGTPADPPVLHTAVPTWQAGDTIPLDGDRTLRVAEARLGSDPDG